MTIRLNRKVYEDILREGYAHSLPDAKPYFTWQLVREDEYRILMNVYLLIPTGEIYTCEHVWNTSVLDDTKVRGLIKVRAANLLNQIITAIKPYRWSLKNITFVDFISANKIQEANVNAKKTQRTN